MVFPLHVDAPAKDVVCTIRCESDACVVRLELFLDRLHILWVSVLGPPCHQTPVDIHLEIKPIIAVQDVEGYAR